jgi:hypothetical protein
MGKKLFAMHKQRVCCSELGSHEEEREDAMQEF